MVYFPKGTKINGVPVEELEINFAFDSGDFVTDLRYLNQKQFKKYPYEITRMDTGESFICSPTASFYIAESNTKISAYDLAFFTDSEIVLTENPTKFANIKAECYYGNGDLIGVETASGIVYINGIKCNISKYFFTTY